MKTTIYILCLSCMLCIAPMHAGALARPGILNHINESTGLKGTSVFKFYKDCQDIMWMGTNMGVSSYDGHSVTNFSIDCAPPLSIVYDITESPDGEILLACKGGLYKVDLKSQSSLRICPRIENVTCFCHASGKLIIGSGHSLWFYRNENETEQLMISDNAISKSNMINDMVFDEKKNEVWIVTNTQIIRLNLKNRSLEKHEVKLSDVHLTSVVMAHGKLYIGTYNDGILCFDPENGTYRPYAPGIQCNVIIDLSCDSKERLYAATDGNGAFVIDVEKEDILHHFHTNDENIPLVSNSVYTIYPDKSTGTCWIGFYEEGFCHNFHTEPTFQIYRHGDINTNQMNVRAFEVQGSQKVIGDRYSLYFIDEERNITHHYAPEQIGHGIITDVQYFKGLYIIATYGNGIYVLNPQTLQLSNTQLPETLHKGRFSRVRLHPDGQTLLAISDLGVYFINEDFQVSHLFTSKNSELPDSYIYDILFDQGGKGWIASMERMSLYDPTTHTIQSHGFAKDFFNETGEISFNLCSNGDILAFSRDNVYRTKPDLSHFTPIDIYNRLQIKQIVFISETSDHKYWIGTERGLFLFDKDFKSFTQFCETDNLPSLRFNKQEFYRDAGDTLWIGNTKGLVYITPEEYKRIPQKKHHPIALRGIYIDGQNLNPQQTLDANKGKTLFPAWDFFKTGWGNQIKFNILELNYGNPKGRYFEYKLDDETGYKVCPAGTSILLESLTLGGHRLKIRIAGYPDTEVTYTIKVYPQWTFYVKLILVLLLISAIPFTVYRRKRRRLRKMAYRRKHELEMEILKASVIRDMQEQQLSKQKTEAEAKAQEIYKKVKLTDEEYAALYRKVKTYVEKERPYVNQELRLSDLAHAIGESTGHLSQMFNVFTQQNFFDFINSYRIGEFKRYIKDPEYNQYTITAICELCGFKRSTFFTAFKRFENCTPSEYLARHNIHRK